MDPERRYLVSHFLRTRYEQTGQPFRLSDAVDGRLPQGLVEVPVAEKLDASLLLAARKSAGFGTPSLCSVVHDWPLVQARNHGEFQRMLCFWQELGLLVGNPKNPQSLLAPESIVLTGEGWRHVSKLGLAAKARPDHAFVAMSFATEFSAAYDQAISPALSEHGWTPVRVDREHHGEKICDKIVGEIRRAGLVVVECSLDRPNVFFEAGFAMGLGVPIIWCIKEERLKAKDVAFDTRQYPHIGWTDEEMLRRKLSERIAALHSRTRGAKST